MSDAQMDLNKSITQCLEQISKTMKLHMERISSMEARLMKLEGYYEEPESQLDKSYGGTKS